MDGCAAEGIANRDEPIPVINLPGSEDASDADRTPGKRDRLKRALTHRRTVSDGQKDGPSSSLQDRIFAK